MGDRHAAIEAYTPVGEDLFLADKIFEGVKFDYIHVSLPRSKITEYRKICLGILHNYDIRPVEIGIWNQPELFSTSMVKPIEHGEDEATATMASAVDELIRCVHQFEGSMEYCHGVGLKQAHLMHAEHGYGLEVMKRLKQALDPYGILNPGKLALT